MATPLVTVFGATGALGARIVQALLSDPGRRFRVRAVTRRPGGGAAQALAALGAEPMLADLDDAASVRCALHGAHAAFCRTLPGVHEAAQARALLDAAAGVPQVLWWLPAPAGVDLRAAAVEPLAIGLAWEELLHPRLRPQRDGHGRLVLHWPLGHARLAGIAGADAGACVAALFARGPRPALRPGQRPLALAGERLGGPAVAARLARLLGEPVLLRHEPPPAPPPGWAESLRRARAADVPGAVAAARRLRPGTLAFERWLAAEAVAWRAACAARRGPYWTPMNSPM